MPSSPWATPACRRGGEEEEARGGAREFVCGREPLRLPVLQGGPALWDVLLGASPPAGRTVLSWFSTKQVAAQGSPFNWDYYSTAGAGFSYRFWNASYAQEGTSISLSSVGQPVVPFGYGLSYTTWAYQNLSVLPASSPLAPLSGCAVVIVSATVCNTGGMDSDEVSQACECVAGDPCGGGLDKAARA